MAQFTCATCNKPFEVVQETLDKYPGWKPRFCMAHRKGGGGKSSFNSSPRGRFASGTASAEPSEQAPAGAAESAEAAPAGPPQPIVPRRVPPGYAYGSRTFGRGLPEREVLTTAEVLEKYQDGPKTGIFTDGSCDPNPGPGGWAFVMVQDGVIQNEQCGGDRDTTNNRMEMTAIIRALDSLPADSTATIYSDSDLCIKTLTEWAKGWKAKGWQRKGGQPIANLDLVISAWEAKSEKPHVALQWVKAHDGSRWNEYADALATQGRRATGSRKPAKS